MENYLVFVDCEEGDWEGVYVNGKLYAEGHRLSRMDFMDLIFEFKIFSPNMNEITLSNKQMEYLSGRLPDDIKSINMNRE